VLANTVRAAARRYGERQAFVDASGVALSFRELHIRSDAVARSLLAAGVGPGNRVVLRLPSTMEYVIAYAATAKLGAVTAGINPKLAAPEQDWCEQLAQPCLVLSDTDQVRRLAADGERANAHLPLPELDDNPQRPVAIVFSSGTTGRPKAALFCEHQLTAVAALDAARWADKRGPNVLSPSEFAHVGFMTKLPSQLTMAARTFVLDRWRADDALCVISEQRMTSIAGAAPQIALMLRSPELALRNWSHVRRIVAGGGPSAPTLVSEARQRFGARYSIRYSSTESGGCGTGTAFDADDEEALYTVGKPRGGVQVEIRNDDVLPIANGDVGELWMRSPSQMTCYWNDPTTTAQTIIDGWIATGDMARLDDRGNVILTGRRKEMYTRGGYNVFPTEVEAVLAGHPSVAQVAVYPVADGVMGEIGVAAIVPRSAHNPPTLEELRRYARSRLAAYKLPEDVRYLDSLPLTAMHKVDRRALIEQDRARGEPNNHSRWRDQSRTGAPRLEPTCRDHGS
jgi:acyl-CoA synthetase (AMP-forming)/AMP-acid ligase II